MAQRAAHPDRKTFHCCLCLELLEVPVLLLCGHSYCCSCIEGDWEKQQILHKCPLCRKKLTPRPTSWSTMRMLAGPQDAPAGAEAVDCDVCMRRKQRATKSCLVCLASYCHTHLKPHYDAALLKKHPLVEPSNNLQKNICSQRDEIAHWKMFCSSDQQCICHWCSAGEHKGHDIVSAAAEERQKQKKLQDIQQSINKGIQDREADWEELQQKVRDINRSADEAVEHSKKIFSQLIRLMEKRSSEVEQQIRFQQEAKVRPVEDLQQTLKEEIAELKSKAAELQQRSHTEDHWRFLHRYSSASSTVHIHPRLSCFKDVIALVSVRSQRILQLLRDNWTNVSLSRVNVLLSAEPQPKTRAEFLRYSCDLKLDPDTAHKQLTLSQRKSRVTGTRTRQPYDYSPDRFTNRFQVLSRQSLTGRHYWEVESYNKGGGVCVAVAYDSISRTGDWIESGFGANDKSWALYQHQSKFEIFYNGFSMKLNCRWFGENIAVYLDHPAGVLSFHIVSDSMDVLYKVQTSFTEPLYAGLGVWDDGTWAEIPRLR